MSAVQVTSRYSGRDSADVITERRLRIPLEAAKYVGALDSRTLALIDCDAEVDVTRRFREVMDLFAPACVFTPAGFRVERLGNGHVVLDLVRDIGFDRGGITASIIPPVRSRRISWPSRS